jgi:hypothetical protein
MPEAKEHLKSCALCRREYRLWLDISSTGRELHEDWDTPDLWANIRRDIEAEPKPQAAWWQRRTLWALAAALLLAATSIPVALHYRSEKSSGGSAATQIHSKTDQEFLTEQALQEVEKNESAYRQSIEKLSRLAQPKLANASSARAVNAREKLLLLDSAIAETRANVAYNRFNTSLQSTLANLYREKQKTLEEVLTHDQKN